MLKFLCVFFVVCSSVAMANTKYEQVKKNGKTYKVIPAEEYLLQTEVPVPTAPKMDGTSIKISLSGRRAWLFQDGELVNTSVTCTGRPGKETPKGTFTVISKHKDWISTIYHVPMPWLLRLSAYSGQIGIHQGVISVKNASHGCIRLPKTKAMEFFNVVPVGTTVEIVE